MVQLTWRSENGSYGSDASELEVTCEVSGNIKISVFGVCTLTAFFPLSRPGSGTGVGRSGNIWVEIGDVRPHSRNQFASCPCSE